jgi:hypothetical protein
MSVVIIEESIDCGLKGAHGAEDTAFQALLGKGCEEAFDGIEPGDRSRREVEYPHADAK